MSYAIGIDLGTTFTAAAVCERGVAPQMMSLGSSGYSVPSVLYLREDGTFLAGEAAELRASGDPTRVARHFKRRLGDDVPIRLDGTPFDALTLTRKLLDWVLDLATSRRGTPPAVVVLTHPANWGDFRVDLLEKSVDVPGAPTMLITEPAAAAMHYVQGERVEPGELIGVYDLGGGTFDAVVMRRTEVGFEPAGRAGGVERLGGVDFDDAIWSYVLSEAEVEIADDEETLAAAYDLRNNCVAAKRLLSVDNVADIRVPMRSATSSVRLNRAEFERRIRPRLADSLNAFDAVLADADLTATDLSRILLVGGSSRIPLVSEMLSQHYGIRIAVDSDPKNAVALGAAGFGGSLLPDQGVTSSFRAHARAASSSPEARRPMVVAPAPSGRPSALPPFPPVTTATGEPSITVAAGEPSVPLLGGSADATPGPAAPPARAPDAVHSTPAPPAPPAPGPAIPPFQDSPPTMSPNPSTAAPPPTPAPSPSFAPPTPTPAPSPSFAPPTPTPAPSPSFAPPTPTPAPSTSSFEPSVPTGAQPATQPGDGVLAGVSTESGHRVRKPVPLDEPAVARFETVSAQAQPVGRSPMMLVAVALAVALALVVVVVMVTR